jgi:hypothetical protein
VEDDGIGLRMEVDWFTHASIRVIGMQNAKELQGLPSRFPTDVKDCGSRSATPGDIAILEFDLDVAFCLVSRMLPPNEPSNIVWQPSKMREQDGSTLILNGEIGKGRGQEIGADDLILITNIEIREGLSQEIGAIGLVRHLYLGARNSQLSSEGCYGIMSRNVAYSRLKGVRKGVANQEVVLFET